MTVKTRTLAPGDLDAVVTIDAALAGRTRRAYFERRLAAALRQPALHLQFAADIDGALAGHALARAVSESGWLSLYGLSEGDFQIRKWRKN